MSNSPRQGTATLAVLIDADNAAPAIVEGLLAEVAKYGVAAVKRIYGDWTKPNLAGWKERLLSHSIQPIQQFRYTVGKNATDSAMIIDAMDLLYTGRFDGFCIVSSDSDFTRLASRIREQGLTVYGFGERKTPKPFVTACDKFIYSDVLRTDTAEADTDEVAAPTRRRSTGDLRQDSRLVRLLQNASQAVSDDEGWATLGGLGTHIAKQAPEFDSRNYGYGKLSELVTATNLFEIETRNGGTNKTLWVRLKRRAKQGEGDGRQPEAKPRESRQADVPASGRAAQDDRAHPESQPAPVPEFLELTEPRQVEPVADLVEVATVPVSLPAEPDTAAPIAGAEAGKPKARRKRPARKPEVKLSETPWPIDSTVLAAPAALAAMATSAASPPLHTPPEPAPVKKARAAAPRKRPARKATRTVSAE